MGSFTNTVSEPFLFSHETRDTNTSRYRSMSNQSLRKMVGHIAIFVAVIAAISLIAIWFNLGPVVHSQVV